MWGGCFLFEWFVVKFFFSIFAAWRLCAVCSVGSLLMVISNLRVKGIVSLPFKTNTVFVIYADHGFLLCDFFQWNNFFEFLTDFLFYESGFNMLLYA